MLKEIAKRFKTPVISILFITIAVIAYYTFKFKNYEWIEHARFYALTVRSIDTYRGTIFINDSIKITATYDNTKPFPVAIESYLIVGDSLVKRMKSDTIFVYRRNTSKKWFVNHH